MEVVECDEELLFEGEAPQGRFQRVADEEGLPGPLGGFVCGFEMGRKRHEARSPSDHAAPVVNDARAQDLVEECNEAAPFGIEPPERFDEGIGRHHVGVGQACSPDESYQRGVVFLVERGQLLLLLRGEGDGGFGFRFATPLSTFPRMRRRLRWASNGSRGILFGDPSREHLGATDAGGSGTGIRSRSVARERGGFAPNRMADTRLQRYERFLRHAQPLTRAPAPPLVRVTPHAESSGCGTAAADADATSILRHASDRRQSGGKGEGSERTLRLRGNGPRGLKLGRSSGAG